MNRLDLAKEMAAAETELRRAQLEHDGSEQARRRYSAAVARVADAELRARWVLTGVSPLPRA